MLVASLHLRCRLCVHSPCLRAQAAAPEAAASSGATVAKKELSNMREGAFPSQKHADYMHLLFCVPLIVHISIGRTTLALRARYLCNVQQ